MKKIYLTTVLAAVLVIPTSSAQEKETGDSFQAPAEQTRFELSTIGELQADGWQETAPDVWTKTFDNGEKGEIAFGTVALEQARARVDARIEALEHLKHRDDEQELQLFELLLHREKLNQVEPLSWNSCNTSTCGLCTGTAFFDHALVRPNFAYPFALAETTFARTLNAGSAYVQAYASFEAGSFFDYGSASDGDSQSNPAGVLTALAAAGGGYPTFSCSAETTGLVYLSGNGIPGQCRRIVVYSRLWSC